jgi:hypothetical protein
VTFGRNLLPASSVQDRLESNVQVHDSAGSKLHEVARQDVAMFIVKFFHRYVENLA